MIRSRWFNRMVDVEHGLHDMIGWAGYGVFAAVAGARRCRR